MRQRRKRSRERNIIEKPNWRARDTMSKSGMHQGEYEMKKKKYRKAEIEPQER
jgi:hypothetical protein